MNSLFSRSVVVYVRYVNGWSVENKEFAIIVIARNLPVDYDFIVVNNIFQQLLSGLKTKKLSFTSRLIMDVFNMKQKFHVQKIHFIYMSQSKKLFKSYTTSWHILHTKVVEYIRNFST
jgi:hypothetical protein